MTLRNLRLDRGLTVERASLALGVKPHSWRYYERTGGMPRDPEVAKRIAEFFGLRVSEVWTAGPEEKAS